VNAATATSLCEDRSQDFLNLCVSSRDEDQLEGVWFTGSVPPPQRDVASQGRESVKSLLGITEAYAKFARHGQSSYSPRPTFTNISSWGLAGTIVLHALPTLTAPPSAVSLVVERDAHVSQWIYRTAAASVLSQLTEDVREFAGSHGLSLQLKRFMELAIASFESHDFRASIQTHPEEDGLEWLEIELAVQGEPDAVMQQYRAFLKSTSEAIPREALRYFRLSLDIR
jgi:hypothetical protein